MTMSPNVNAFPRTDRTGRKVVHNDGGRPSKYQTESSKELRSQRFDIEFFIRLKTCFSVPKRLRITAHKTWWVEGHWHIVAGG